MALDVKGGQFTTATSTGNQSITGLGFQPKLLMFYSTLASGDKVFSPSYGFAESSSARWAMGNAIADGAGARLFTSSKCFTAPSSLGGAPFLEFDFVSHDADGFTINMTTAPGPGYPINYLAIGGSDISVDVGIVDSNTSTGNQAKTGVGFLPKAVLMCSCDEPGNDGTAVITDCNQSIGFGVSSSKRATVSTECVPSGTSNAFGVLDTSKLFTLLASGAAYAEADLVSLDADGFTFNITTAPAGAIRLGYVAFGGTAQFEVGTFAQPASTGNQAITGVGFQPSAEILISGGKTSSNLVTDHARLMLGAAVSSSDRGLFYVAQLDNSASDPEIRSLSRLLSSKFTADDATTVLAEADFVSQDADGFTQNWTTADATARVTAFLAIGAESVGGGDASGSLIGGDLFAAPIIGGHLTL